MNENHNEFDKMTRELLGKSLLKPSSVDFNDRLMEKIRLAQPSFRQNADNGIINKAWRYLWIALVCMLASIALVAKFSGGYFTGNSLLTNLTFSYILYGGMMLLVPVVFYQLDALIQVMYWKKAGRSSVF